MNPRSTRPPRPPTRTCWRPWVSPLKGPDAIIIDHALEQSGARWVRCTPVPGLVADVQLSPQPGVWVVRWAGSDEGSSLQRANSIDEAKLAALHEAERILREGVSRCAEWREDNNGGNGDEQRERRSRRAPRGR